VDHIDAIVIGAGVVGLAIARTLAAEGRSVLILEREARFGTGTSSRSSEVIHAGLHYSRGSLRERLCLAGKHLLYEWAATHGVPHRAIGKLTVAVSENERARLETLFAHARAAEADDALTWLDTAQARASEPALACVAAIHSPSSGIIDSHAYMASLLGNAQDNGALLAVHAPVERIVRCDSGWQVRTLDATVACDIVVNAAGLGAWDVARRIEPLDPDHVPPRFLAKGSYFAYAGRVPFARLIYPLPVAGGLGTHLTLDLAGQARFGPDVAWVDGENYRVDEADAPRFTKAIGRFWPDVDPERLQPAYSGIRPKLAGPGEPEADWLIADEVTHGLPGLVNLFGIDSPGLTASLAIGEHVTAVLG
jgi:L-2-hydroxyglutarate oxidase LhgO